MITVKSRVKGDSGGPLNWEDAREDSSTEGTKYVIGIVSWGQGCARYYITFLKTFRLKQRMFYCILTILELTILGYTQG